jgi:hypothetical protein
MEPFRFSIVAGFRLGQRRVLRAPEEESCIVQISAAHYFFPLSTCSATIRPEC